MNAPAPAPAIDSQCISPEQGGASDSSDIAAQGPVDKAAARRVVSVLLPLPLPAAYDYSLPDGLDAEPGHFVTVPLGSRQAVGVVWGMPSRTLPAAKLRDVIGVLDVPPMHANMRALVDWIAVYTVSAPGAVLRMVMSSAATLQPPRTETIYALADDATMQLAATKLTPARRRVVEFLAAAPALPLADIAREAGVGAGVIKGLATAGVLAASERQIRRQRAAPDPEAHGPALSEAQAAHATVLVDAVRQRSFGVTLLDGVPGAGKTEVYFEAVAQALREGRQVLVLLPEIALSAQWLDRFTRRFGASPAEWHSDLTSTERRATWRDVADGSVGVVVGARSALFLPFRDLALIVVDEEHDASFKQEDGVVYNARDMAVVRARLEACPVVLCSATPSLETWNNAANGRYASLRLPERHGAAAMPPIARIDMRRDPPPRGRFLSGTVREAIRGTVAAGQQVLLFLNRRGYAPLTLCRACGHRLECPNCRAWLVEHRFRQRLVCHHCGHDRPQPRECPACQATESFVACGPGVERVAEELQSLLPEARVAIFSSDLIPGRAAAQEIIAQVERGDVDILIGTQMAAKGHHFPKLTLVVVVDADLGLAGGDLRAAERTFQLLYQVVGRAGRAEHPGRALLQTWDPQQRVIAALASGDRDAFLTAELAARDDAGMPPFGRLAALIVSGTDESTVARVAGDLARAAPAQGGVRVWGPVPPPLAVLRGRFRRRLLLVAERGTNVPALVRAWVASVATPGATRIQVDVDPYSFL